MGDITFNIPGSSNVDAGDGLSFDTVRLREQVKQIEDEKKANIRGQEDLLDHITTVLKPRWTTTNGKDAVRQLTDYANNNYNDYILAIESNIQALYDAIDILEQIDRA